MRRRENNPGKSFFAANAELPTLAACLNSIYKKVNAEGLGEDTSHELEGDIQTVSDRFGISPKAAVLLAAILENDANAGALAEWFFGSGKGKQNVVYLTMSTGVGAGVVADGHLLHGVGGNAAEMGHVILDIHGPLCNCGQRGCLEAYTGGRAIQQRLQAYLKDKPNHAFFRLPCVDGKVENLDFRALLEGVRERIPLALEWWDEFCLRLAQGVGAVATAYNPEVIVLGTTAYHAGDLLMEPLQRLLPRFMWKEYYTTCTVRTSALGLRIGEMAGASVGFCSLLQKGAWKAEEA